MKTLKNILLGIAFSLSLSASGCWLFPEKPHLLWDDYYPGVAVFAYKENKITDDEMNNKFNELSTTSEIFISENFSVHNESLEEWFDKQAGKYNESINIPLTLYKEQIKVPIEFINEADNFPVDIRGFSNYLRKNYGLNNYDFISIIINESNGAYAGYADRYSFSFLVNVLPAWKAINGTFAHEFSHLLGATDKYSSDYEGKVDNKDLMRNAQTNLDDYIIITDPTAVEIGW